MKCQSCGKKEAIVKYNENINGKESKLYFCEKCAKNLGFVDFSNIFSPIFINIEELVSKEKSNNLKDKKEQEIRILKSKIKKSIDKEDYENAAIIRDKIKKIEKINNKII